MKKVLYVATFRTNTGIRKFYHGARYGKPFGRIYPKLYRLSDLRNSIINYMYDNPTIDRDWRFYAVKLDVQKELSIGEFVGSTLDDTSYFTEVEYE